MSNGEHRSRRRRRHSGTSRNAPDGTPRSLSEEVEGTDDEDTEHAAPTPGNQPDENELDFTPRGRLAEVEKASGKSGAYEREYRLQLVHRLLMRRIPLDQIATQLGVSVTTVQRYRQELYKRLRREAKDIDIHQFIGDTFGFYDEISAMALRGASQGKTPLNIRLAALRTAMTSKDHLIRFLNEAGVLEVLKYEPNKTEGKQDLEKIVDMTKALLKSDHEAETGLELPEGTLLDDDDEEIHLL